MTATSGRLLISHITLRGPELAQVYATIAAYPESTLDDLRGRLCPAPGTVPHELADAPLREVLSFLSITGLIATQGRVRRYTVTTTDTHASFPLLMLHALTAHADPRQRALSAIQRILVANDTLTIASPALRAQIERGPLRNLFAWTGEKVHFWSQLMAYLGLVRRPERFLDVILVPQPHLVFEALRWAQQQVGRVSAVGDMRFSLAGALHQIDTALFACFTERGRVHQGLVQTLTALEYVGTLEFTHHTDAAQSLLLGDRRVSDVRFITME